MSQAEVRWPGAGRPVQLTKWVSAMPRDWAFWFIWSTKADSLPARRSARATAQSLPETTATHLIRSETESCSPSFK